MKFIHFLHPCYHPKLIWNILKNVQNNKCVCVNEIIWLVMIKMRMKMKNRSNRYDINRNRPRHGHKYTKYKMYLSVMMVMCNKKHLSNIWSWTHEELNNTEAELKKKALLIKKACIISDIKCFWFKLHITYVFIHFYLIVFITFIVCWWKEFLVDVLNSFYYHHYYHHMIRLLIF